MTEILCKGCGERKRSFPLGRFRSKGFLLDEGWTCSEACLRRRLVEDVSRSLESPVPEVDHQHRARIGTILVRRGWISLEDLARVAEERNGEGATIGARLLKLGLCTEDQLTAALSEQQGVPWVGDVDARIDPGAAGVLPRQLCLDFKILPFQSEIRSQSLFVAARSPVQVILVHMVRRMLGRTCRIFLFGDRYFDEVFERWVVSRSSSAETVESCPPSPQGIAGVVCRKAVEGRAGKIRSVRYESGFWFRLGRRAEWFDLFVKPEPLNAFAGPGRQTFPRRSGLSG